MAILAERMTKDNSTIELMELVDPEHTRAAELPRKIGFDRVVVSLEVTSIDWNMLDIVYASETGMPRSLSLFECRSQEKCLAICAAEDQQHWYSSIKVQVASNTFTMKKCNLPGCRDICLFEICIPPIEGHECLGNIHNLSCEQEKLRVREMMDELERYGIFCNRDYAVLKQAEINVNIFLVANNVGFKDAVEMLRPHRHGLDRFHFSDYAAKLENNDREYTIFKVDEAGRPWVKTLGIKERSRTSFNSVGRSLVIKVYDKAAETIEKSGGFIEFVSPITRIEFFISAPNLIPYYFGQENLFEMTQDDIENAFHHLADKFIRRPLMEYYSKITYGFEKYFESIDINEFAWRKNVVMTMDNTIKKTDDFYIIPYEELVRYVGLIQAPSIKKNRARIAKELKEEFRKRNAQCIRITNEDIAKQLVDWLCTITGEEEQNIIYRITDDEDNE